MPAHEELEERFALAALGQVSEEEWAELAAHLKECSSCRGSFAEIQKIHSQVLPEHPDFEIKRNADVEGRLKQSILTRAAADGAHFSAATREPASQRPSAKDRGWAVPVWKLTLAAGILLALVASGVLLGGRFNGSQSVSLEPLPIRAIESVPPPIPLNNGAGQAAKLEVANLELALRQSEAERKNLERRLKQAEEQANSLEQSNSKSTVEIADLRGQLDFLRASEAGLEHELAKVKATNSDRTAELVLVRSENQDLRDKLNTQTVSVDHERELMADGREIRDLIAARNLHIIDVYDTNGEGKTQKAFGRVFYTEGKSLVFYAYDLSPHHTEDGKYAYAAWGKRDSSQQVVRNLGIFFNDDQKQRRWVLTITDPRVLSEIDSVFVTLEPTDKLGVHPSGKSLLSAYLGSSPNHP